jgi:riboflavin kinase/FMN adenylyltransferase
MTLAPSPTPVSNATRPPLLWRAAVADAAPAPAPIRGAVLAIGNFDGVHRGHKALLAQARALAAARAAPLAVMTFEPHPRSFFRPDEPVFRLSQPDVRADLLAEAGVAAIAELGFDAAMAQMGADAFVDSLLVDRLGVAGVVVGRDFRFGHRRAGDVALLRERLAPSGAVVAAVEAVRDEGGEVVSSSRIRDALEKGDVAAANALLGHRWRVRAEVAHGDKRGRELGYPTANMLLPSDCRLRHGIYAVAVRIDGAWLPGAASFGRRPTFDNGAPRLETHLLDFAGDLYGRRLEVAFAGFIRGEEKFDDIAALQRQMAQDCEAARAILRS